MPRILLVDDCAQDRELAQEALAAFGFDGEVVPLCDGADALDYLYRRGEYAELTDPSPSVILLDLKMPRVDGLEVLRQIKSDATLKMIPVVVMTSSRMETDLIKSYQLGVNSYVIKPVKFDEFVETIKKVGVFWTRVNQSPPRGAVTGGSGK